MRRALLLGWVLGPWSLIGPVVLAAWMVVAAFLDTSGEFWWLTAVLGPVLGAIAAVAAGVGSQCRREHRERFGFVPFVVATVTLLSSASLTFAAIYAGVGG